MPSNAELNRRIGALVREFKDAKEIGYEVGLDRRLVTNRLWYLGYRKHFISDEERLHLLQRRKAQAAQSDKPEEKS